MVNLKMLEGMGRTQVLCSSEEEAKMFCNAMWEQYPDRMRPAWTRWQTNWRTSTLKKWYIPRIDRYEDETADFCQSANYKQPGYKEVIFKDLIAYLDLGEINISDLTINNLLNLG